jgi:hypothetical protein
MTKLMVENWRRYLNKHSFVNELGNDFVIGILMKGPTSTMTNTITYKEAEELRNALVEFLND